MLSKEVIGDVEYRMAAAHEKYGRFNSPLEARGALDAEVDEVREAIQERKPWKVREEMLDVANVALRWVEQYDNERKGTV